MARIRRSNVRRRGDASRIRTPEATAPRDPPIAAPTPRDPMTPDLGVAFTRLDAGLPLLLLPVRLETRFRRGKLCIRIYPDAIHVDSHEPGLTSVERDDGVAYWGRRNAADASEDDVAAANDDLVAQHGVRRAAWIARATRDGAQPTIVETDQAGSPRAAALPARFAAIGYRGDRIAYTRWGNPIPGDLRLGPTGDWAWITDYAEAKTKGLAIEIDDAEGVDLLVVAGVSAGDGATTLEALLESHRYTDGLAFVPQGTPTNNTDESTAGWTADEADPAGFLAAELDETALPIDPDANSLRFRAAIGLPRSDLPRRLDHAEDEAERQQQAMNRLLWPVTWGRYLDELIAGRQSNPISANGRAFARDWFIDKVRGGAPLPAFRVGSQPYGLLPVRLSVDRARVSENDQYLEETLRFLRETWRSSLAAVPRMDPTRSATGGDADQTAEEDLVAILGSLPHPAQFAVRTLWNRRDLTLDAWDYFLVDVLADGPQYGGIGKRYLATRDAGGIQSLRDQYDAIEDMRRNAAAYVPSENRENLEGLLSFMETMLGWYGDRFPPLDDPKLPGLDVKGVQERSVDDPIIYYSAYEDDSLVFTRPLVEAEGAGPGARAIDYIDDLVRRLGGATPARAASRPGSPASVIATAPRVAVGTQPLSDEFLANKPLLYQLLDASLPLLTDAQKTNHRIALQVLRDLDVATIELRLRETLGLAANRLDAWFTSLARDRLDTMRAARPSGVNLGAFGFLHDVRPDKKGTAESQGFVLAPSMAHAATAAVLRSGWSGRGTAEATSPLAVDLRSDRVRTAAELLDGVRQGQTLGDLLGCRFERRLHDDALDRYIDDVRRAVLAAGGITREPTGPVDGLELDEAVAAGALEGVLDASGGDRAKLVAALDDVVAAIDAVGDATIAESVHQLLGGNLARASATLEAIGSGAAPPPELRSMRTHRSGAGITHRVMVMLGAAGAAPWSAGPRATFDPWLESWIAGLVGVAAEITFTATLSSGGTMAVSMGELGISALDAVFDAPLDDAEGESLWARRVSAYVLGKLPPDAPDDVTVTVDATRASEASLLCASLRSLLAGSRAIGDRELVEPGVEATAVSDAADLASRVDALVTQFRDRAGALTTLVAAASADLVELRAAMLALSGYALADAVPTIPARESRRAELIAQATRLSEAATTMVEAIDELDDDPAAVARLVLGERVPVLGRLIPSAAATLGDAFRRDLLKEDPAAATGWLQQVGRVRADAARLDEALALSDWVAARNTASVRVAQLPIVDGEPWVATAAPTAEGGRLAIFAVDHGAIDALGAGNPIAGLLIDEWVERVPGATQTLGAAIHFDAPAARPPQSLLLLVPPEDRSWSLDLVADMLVETFEAATLRTVGAEAIDSFGHHLPAIHPPVDISAGTQPSPNP